MTMRNKPTIITAAFLAGLAAVIAICLLAIPAGAQDEPDDVHLSAASLDGDTLTLTLNDGDAIQVDLSTRKVRNIPAINPPSEGACLTWQNGGGVWDTCGARPVTGSATVYYAYSEDRTFTSAEFTGANGAHNTVAYTSANPYSVTIAKPSTPTGTWTYTDSTCHPSTAVCGWEGLAVSANVGRPQEIGVEIASQIDASWHTQTGGPISINGAPYTVLVKNAPTQLASAEERLHWPAWTMTGLADITDPGWDPPTIYFGWSEDATFTEAEFAGSSVGLSPMTTTLPTTTLTSARFAIAVPDTYTLTQFGFTPSHLSLPANWCGSTLDCSAGVAVTIGGESYEYYATHVAYGTVFYAEEEITVAWSE